MSSLSRRIIVLVVTTTLFTTASCEDIFVVWNVKSSVISFGKTAEFECIVSDSVNYCNKTLRQWYGGNPYGVLCRNGACRNQGKYEEKQNSMCSYTLIINNFSESDVNCDYTCAYGVHRSRKMLKLDNVHFSYLPVKNDINYTINVGDMLNATIYIHKSFPKPLCHTIFAGNMIISTSTMTSITCSYWYQTEISIMHTPPVNICHGLLEVRCMIGSSQLTLVCLNVTLCKGLSEQPNQSKLSFIILLLSTILIPIIVFTLIQVFLKKVRSSRYLRSKQVQRTQLSYRYTPPTDTEVQTAVSE